MPTPSRPWPGLVPAILDRVVEEAHGQLDMEAGAVAGLAVGVDRAAVPHCLQRIDRGRDDTARGLAVGRGDQADAAGIAFDIRGDTCRARRGGHVRG